MTTRTQSPQRGHESSRVPLKATLWCLAGFIATAVVTHLALIGYGRFLGASHEGFGRVYQIGPNQVPHYPAPALQVKPPVDLQTYRNRAERDLNSYGWMDQERGVAKIPVEQAITLLVIRGLPVRPAVQNGPTELDMQRQKAAADSAAATKQTPERRRP